MPRLKLRTGPEAGAGGSKRAGGHTFFAINDDDVIGIDRDMRRRFCAHRHKRKAKTDEREPNCRGNHVRVEPFATPNINGFASRAIGSIPRAVITMRCGFIARSRLFNVFAKSLWFEETIEAIARGWIHEDGPIRTVI